jgi:hypothetical protein
MEGIDYSYGSGVGAGFIHSQGKRFVLRYPLRGGVQFVSAALDGRAPIRMG